MFKLIMFKLWKFIKDVILHNNDYEEILDLKNKIVNSVLSQKEEIIKLKDQVEQLNVQLAGVSVAALGGTKGSVVAKQGDYGWSVPYQDVLDLRIKYDQLVEEFDKLCERVYG